MKRIVWVLPVGLEFDRVLASLKREGDAFYIFHSKPDNPVGTEAKRFADKVETYLKAGPFTVKDSIEVDVLSLSDCIKAFQAVLARERQAGDAFTLRVNIGTSSKIMALAALYVASRDPDRFELFYPKTETYLIMDIVRRAEEALDKIPEAEVPALDPLREAIGQYRASGWTTRTNGEYDDIWVPIIPMQELSETQMAILDLLQEAGGDVDSAATLARALAERGKTKAESIEGAQSSVSFALGALRGWRFVRTETEGRKKRVILTEAGRLYRQIVSE